MTPPRHERIVVDARNIQAHPTGVGSYARALLPELIAQAPAQWEWVIVRHGSNPDRLFAHLPHVHEVFVDQAIGLLDDFLLGAGTLHKIFRSLGPPSLYHNLFHVSPLFMQRLGAYTPRHIVTLHDLIWMQHAFQVKQHLSKALFFKLYGSLAIPHTLHHADRVICVSEATRQAASRWMLEPGKATTIPHGVGTEFFEEHAPPAGALAHLAAQRYVVAVGNDKPYKNLAALVRAFARVRAQLDQGHLVLVGACSGLEPLVQALGLGAHVTLPGFLADATLRSVMAHARVFVFPSLVEGFGLPPLEAMALGVPTIVSDLEPMRGVVARGAVRVDPRDAGELERCLLRLLTRDDLAGELGRRGRERARTFSWATSAQRTLHIYHDVLST